MFPSPRTLIEYYMSALYTPTYYHAKSPDCSNVDDRNYQHAADGTPIAGITVWNGQDLTEVYFKCYHTGSESCALQIRANAEFWSCNSPAHANLRLVCVEP